MKKLNRFLIKNTVGRTEYLVIWVRQKIIHRKYSGTDLKITRFEEILLQFISWVLDIFDDAKHGNWLDELERLSDL